MGRASDKDIKELIDKLKVFKEDGVADLLHQCHNAIRNREHLDPAVAFDEIAKILFMKVCFERRLVKGKYRRNLFTADFLDEQSVLHKNPVDVLFRATKEEYEADYLFADDEEIRLKLPTVREIVRMLERYNLSATSEDVKGIAFERFLGRTFRGEIGQFFTPREIVKFMIEMVDPKFGDVICDPASGSGGFLIRFFAKVRDQILAETDAEYAAFKTEVDANDRMTRTSKMNMIMHGDGHGGVHHWNGFLNVNGVFPGRFDVILTNPPFGAHVEPTAMVEVPEGKEWEDSQKRYAREYGDLYRSAVARAESAKGKPIADLFELPKRGGKTANKLGKIKTELLFIERCLDLLTDGEDKKPAGRLGIVLPEGVFNNPSLAFVREFVEDREFLRAVVSLPQETFFSTGASVKASILFLQKFTPKEKTDYDAKQAAARAETEAKYAKEIAARTKQLEEAIEAAKQSRDAVASKARQRELTDYQRAMAEKIAAESRQLLKQRFNYPVFLYEAEHVGITATGEPDVNELYPNDRQPPGIERT